MEINYISRHQTNVHHSKFVLAESLCAVRVNILIINFKGYNIM